MQGRRRPDAVAAAAGVATLTRPLSLSAPDTAPVLVIDNNDTLTYNLVQYLMELGAAVEVRRNDAVTVADVLAMAPSQVVISPGPCTPDEAGISLELVTALTGRVPLLGVCLGHQCIGQAFGAQVVHAHSVMHGKTSMVQHDARGVFRGLPSPFEATRYHSLVLAPDSLPACLEIAAWTGAPGDDDYTIMGVRHRDAATHGVQFHPEAILTEHGHALLANFLGLPSGPGPRLQASVRTRHRGGGHPESV